MRTLMKQIIVTMAALFIVFAVFTLPSYALSDEQSAAIQTLLDDACRISGVPGISISVIEGDETFFFSSGYANREEALPANETTLFELASVSKAFTGMGILLLEEQGLLSMDDPIDKYLPWLSFRYKGESVDMSSMTLYNFLHHTSGITNGKHGVRIPEGNTPDMLQKTIEALLDSELTFSPGERYEYGTINYDVLALVIELVSGQRFEDYMKEKVFEPLGLHNTFLYSNEAKATGNMAQGYRTSFFVTTPYNALEYGGNKAAGYIISSARDMARWMSIQMGIIQDIPEAFRRVIAKSHEGNISVSDVHGMYYAAGWEINTDQTFIRHAGGNPNFSTNVYLFPKEQVAICLLSNSANTNIELVKNIKHILDGNLTQTYKISDMQLLDIILSSVTIIFCLLTIFFFILGLRRKKMNDRKSITKKRIRITIIWTTITVVTCIICGYFPMLVGFNWPVLLVWQGYSPLTFLVSMPLLTASITWFVSAPQHSYTSKLTT